MLHNVRSEMDIVFSIDIGFVLQKHFHNVQYTFLHSNMQRGSSVF